MEGEQESIFVAPDDLPYDWEEDYPGLSTEARQTVLRSPSISSSTISPTDPLSAQPRAVSNPRTPTRSTPSEIDELRIGVPTDRAPDVSVDALPETVSINAIPIDTRELVSGLTSSKRGGSITTRDASIAGLSINKRQAANILSMLDAGRDDLTLSLVTDMVYGASTTSPTKPSLSSSSSSSIARTFVPGSAGATTPSIATSARYESREQKDADSRRRLYERTIIAYVDEIAMRIGTHHKRSVAFCVARKIASDISVDLPANSAKPYGRQFDVVATLAQLWDSNAIPVSSTTTTAFNNIDASALVDVLQLHHPWLSSNEALKYAYAWMFELIFVLTDRERDFINTEGIAAVAEVRAEQEANMDSSPSRVDILPILSEEGFLFFLSQLPLDALKTVVDGIVGRCGQERRSCPSPIYTFSLKDLTLGNPISPPAIECLMDRVIAFYNDDGAHILPHHTAVDMQDRNACFRFVTK